jgi:hemerythrin superfamily protein
MAQPQNDKPSAGDRAGGNGAPSRPPADQAQAMKAGADSDAIEMLRADHRRVEQLFGAFKSAAEPRQKSLLAQQICTELTVHTMLEEEIFYPACRGHMDDRLLDEAQVEHDGAKALIIEIEAGSPDDRYFDAKVTVLGEDIAHHVREEEKPDTGVFAKAKVAGLAAPDLAKRLAARKQALMEQAKTGALGPPRTQSFRVCPPGIGQSRENDMSQSSMTRERDEYGRFVSEDDDRDYRRRRYADDDRRSMPPRDEDGRFVRSRSRYDDDDRPMPRRDEEGRFVSGRSRYDEDDDRRGNRGHGGWYGDPRGHAEASRRGWEERSGTRYRDDDDDRGYMRSRSRYEDDEDRRGRRGHGGWYGDPEGHADAAYRGWEEREGSRYRDDDDRRYARSRSRYDDDGRRRMPARDDEGRFVSSGSRYDEDDDRRGGRGHGGWYGDPEGHSEAARRGRR